MHVVNIMFSYIAGGIEQAFIDYCEGLQRLGHQVTAITHPDAVVNAQLNAIGVPVISIRNYNRWDLLAIRRLKHQVKALKPDVVIAHANRALAMTLHTLKSDFPLVGIAQNYTTSLLIRADAAFATTNDLIASLEAQGIARRAIYHIPNMVRCAERPVRPARHAPVVIGTMGRFVKKKGFDVYIEALRLLQERGYSFRALLGGSGVEEKALKKQASSAGLDRVLTFPGWVEDKKAFYTGIDIFCLPSLHEPFGIVLLEAFTYGAPVIATDSEGPRDIITPEHDALIVEKNNASALADAMARLLDAPELAERLAANAFDKTRTHYTLDVVAGRIETALQDVVARWNELS